MAEPEPISNIFTKWKPPLPLVYDRNGAFEIDDPVRGIYDIEHRRCHTHAQLLEWILHLSEKSWITPRHISELILRASARFPAIKIDRRA